MERSKGSAGIPLVECTNRYIVKYRVRWDVRPVEDSEEYHDMVSYYETDIVSKTKPRLKDVKDAVINGINNLVERCIVEQYMWQGMAVWLSVENQINYKAAYDLCVQSGGENLPITIKLGSADVPVYYTFESETEIADFYKGVMRHISDTLAMGWEMKDSIKWEEYDVELQKFIVNE